MARGELTVYGTDVVDALTECNAKTNYERVLNSDGETLADLIAERVMRAIMAKLWTPNEKSK